MIRLATPDDWPRVVEMMQECHLASNYSEPFCQQSAIKMLSLADGYMGVCLVNDDVSGFLYLLLTPLHFNHACISANELGFWGRDGKALIEAGKAWATERGASRLMLGAEDQIRGKAMERFYRMAGLTAFGRSYQMRLYNGRDGSNHRQ